MTRWSPALGRAALLLGWGFVPGAVNARAAEVIWRTEASPVAVEVTGVAPALRQALADRRPDDPEWAKVLAVYAEQVGATAGLPPMAGTWRVAGERLRFEPRYPLTRSVRYRAEFIAAGAALVVSHFELPAEPAPARTAVVQVFPTAGELPENQLKFYVHFSAPMSRGEAYSQIQLRDAAGRPVELAFLELGEELWDPAMTRLTLLVDPGRIKRGVRPLEEVGPVFEAGQTYTLTIGAGCRDAAGRPLAAAFTKTIRVGAADRIPPDPARWKIRPPPAGTRAPLQVEFDEPLDHALALRLIGVNTANGACPGEASLAAQERLWQFVPEVPWTRGSHRLVVATTIEDLAGNNIGKAFDVDQFERVNRRIAAESVTLPFEVQE